MSKRYIGISPGYGGNLAKWRVEGLEGDVVYDADGPFDTKAEAIEAVATYAEYMGWAAGSFTLTVDE